VRIRLGGALLLHVAILRTGSGPVVDGAT
jgi:hypothetical protein